MKAPLRQRPRTRLPLARPTTRAACAGTGRPCPWVSCRFNLALDVTPAGSLVLGDGARPGVLRLAARAHQVEAFVERAVARLVVAPESCALDVAERAGPPADDRPFEPHQTRDAIAALLGVKRERVRQLEVAALARLRRRAAILREEG